VKTALKSLDFQAVTDKNKLAPFFMAHGVYCGFCLYFTGHCAVCVGVKKVLMRTELKWVVFIVCITRLWHCVILSVLSSKQFLRLLRPVNSFNVKNTILVCCIYCTHYILCQLSIADQKSALLICSWRPLTVNTKATAEYLNIK